MKSLKDDFRYHKLTVRAVSYQNHLLAAPWKAAMKH